MAAINDPDPDFRDWYMNIIDHVYWHVYEIMTYEYVDKKGQKRRRREMPYLMQCNECKK